MNGRRGAGLTHQDFDGLLLGHDFVLFVPLVLEVVNKAYVLTDSLLVGTANRMMYEDRLDLDVDQLYCQVSQVPRLCCYKRSNQLVSRQLAQTGPVLPDDMAPSYPGPGGRSSSRRAATTYASPCDLTFAEETIEVRGEGRLRFRYSATTFTTQAKAIGYDLSASDSPFRTIPCLLDCVFTLFYDP